MLVTDLYLLLKTLEVLIIMYICTSPELDQNLYLNWLTKCQTHHLSSIELKYPTEQFKHFTSMHSFIARMKIILGNLGFIQASQPIIPFFGMYCYIQSHTQDFLIQVNRDFENLLNRKLFEPFWFVSNINTIWMVPIFKNNFKGQLEILRIDQKRVNSFLLSCIHLIVIFKSRDEK